MRLKAALTLQMLMNTQRDGQVEEELNDRKQRQGNGKKDAKMEVANELAIINAQDLRSARAEGRSLKILRSCVCEIESEIWRRNCPASRRNTE